VGRGRTLSRAAELLLVAVIGGALALGGAAAFGKLGSKTVVQRIEQPAGQTTAASASGTKSIADIYKASAPGVVQITSTSVVEVPTDPFFGDVFPPQRQEQSALGSGFVIDKDGHIVTNYHVIQGAKTIKVGFSDNLQVTAKVVGSDPSTDLAVLKVGVDQSELTPLPLGDSGRVAVGDPVVAIGNPFGLTRTATYGIVSALGRPIEAPNQFTIDHAIQTDAALNHGNSGGPLLNLQGQVIGVNSQISTGGTGDQGNVGIGFAVPANTVKSVVAQILRSGKVEHAYMGVSVTQITSDLSSVARLPIAHGLLVTRVQAGTASAKAGLRAGKTQVTVGGQSYLLGGDVIVAVDGKPVSTTEALRAVIAQKRPGDTIELQLYRGSKKTTLKLQLGPQPSLSPSG
jgi:S1-C subfamily serine protease